MRLSSVVDLTEIVSEIYTARVFDADTVTVEGQWLTVRRGDHFVTVNIGKAESIGDIDGLMRRARAELDTLVARMPDCLPSVDAATYYGL
jgi:hypothetical protein